MPQKFIKLLACFVITLGLGTNQAKAQLFQDSVAMRLVKKDIDCIYNQQFKSANDICQKIKELYPEHPVVFLLEGLSTYWRNYPMLDTSPERVSFEKELRQSIRLAEKNTNPAYSAEYLLANLCSKGLLLKYYDENNHIMEALPLVSSIYKYVKRSFKFTGECSDLYYYTGAYNYYRVAYPEIYPVYKPLAMLLQQGNKEKGLSELHFATTKAVVLRAESYSLLASIYLNFENKYELSCNYSKSLHEIYPDNMLYLSIYIKSLLLLKQYDEAEKLTTAALKSTENKFFQAQLIVFQGIIYEKKYHNFIRADQYYNTGISNINHFGEFGHEYMAYAYFGLSRISNIRNDKNIGNMYRQKALKYGDFKKINFDK
jgi:hypothetical protein